MKTPRLPLRTPLLALATFLLVACEGPDHKAMMDEVRNSVPPMAADESYFDGQVVVRLSLGSNVSGAALFGGYEGSGNAMMTGFSKGNGQDKFGGTGGMGSGGSASPEMELNTSEDARKREAKQNGPYQGNEGMSRIAEQEDPESPEARRRREAQMPPTLLRMLLQNPGAATLVVQIRDVDSELGNFAIRPDTVTLAPGQSIEVEPMQSMLGLQSHALPVTITLRADGKTQTKILTLRPVPAAAATPTPAK